MLCLTRKRGERVVVVVGDVVFTVEVNNISKGEARLAFDADRDSVRIMREEIYNNVKDDRDTMAQQTTRDTSQAKGTDSAVHGNEVQHTRRSRRFLCP